MTLVRRNPLGSWQVGALVLALSLPSMGSAYAAAPKEQHEQLLVAAGEHSNAGRHDAALQAYADAFEAMSVQLRVSGVGELVALEAGSAAIADYQARGERESLKRGRAVILAFMQAVRTAGPGIESVPLDAVKQQLVKLDALIPADELAVGSVEEDDEPATEQPQVELEPTQEESSTNDSGRQPLAAMGKAGVGLLVVGGVVVNAGVALLIRQPTYFPRDDPQATYLTTTRPAGWALLGSGVATVVVGAVLLGVERSRARSRSNRVARSRRRAVVAHPWVAPGSGGVGLLGRF
ncbi:MAG: hypothetical protein AAGF11_42560 [Myxococcota bacterium]